MVLCLKFLTSSLMIKLGRRPGSSGGIKEPRRLDGPEPGANDPFRSGAGLFSRMTSILGASTAGAWISGTITAGTSCEKFSFDHVVPFFHFFFFRFSSETLSNKRNNPRKNDRFNNTNLFRHFRNRKSIRIEWKKLTFDFWSLQNNKNEIFKGSIVRIQSRSRCNQIGAINEHVNDTETWKKYHFSSFYLNFSVSFSIIFF